jgi:heme O synthase-like polyprenyltransferase
MRRRDLRSARRLFFGSLLYLPAVLTALVIDRWI